MEAKWIWMNSLFLVAMYVLFETSAAARPNSGVVALCVVVKDRALDAEDIKPSNGTRQSRSYRPYSQEDICKQGSDRIQVLIRHLNTSITFLRNLKNLKYNSAVIATRTVQAQIGLALEQLKTIGGEIKLHSTILKELMDLEARSKTISIRLEDKNSKNWNLADRMTSAVLYWKSPKQNGWKPWEILGSKEIHAVSHFKNMKKYNKHHKVNNKCHIRMTRDCDLSQKCADILMDRSAEITTLAHDVAFFNIAIKMGCVQEIQFTSKFPNSDWAAVVEDHCSKMWDEANTIASANWPMGYKGIFLIHASNCALVGYPNFLRADWMNSIMSWMDSTTSGCIAPDTKSGKGNIALGFDDFAAGGEWCTIYETSLGVQLLSMHLRYLLEKCPNAAPLA